MINLESYKYNLLTLFAASAMALNEHRRFPFL